MNAPPEHKHTNALIHETSPYLLQHAHNPVDWRPWGDEAIEEARAKNKPIFLSVGYSACHWCHVMERESFENEAIAEIVNERFVCIKVDREERPDIDDIYMQAVQMMTGSGGWPMSVFMTPELKPFFGGTYYPPEDGPRGIGFGSLVKRLSDHYHKDPEKISQTTEQVFRALDEESRTLKSQGRVQLSHEILAAATGELIGRYDPIYGGFGAAPKFPPSMALNLLLRERLRTGDPQMLEIAERTLTHMANGGINDHLGGGFARYSTDARWLAPHFEKMLYDNALLAPLYFDVFRITGNGFYEEVGRSILDYILRDMTQAEGGYSSAEDADSEGVEGKFYLWDRAEVEAILGPEDAGLFCEYYDVTESGNFEGRNILNVIRPLEEFARGHDLQIEDIKAQLGVARQKLLSVRDGRVRPGKDDKIITAWNGMMISAMARGAQATGDDRYRASAEGAARFILRGLRDDEGNLLRTYRAGQAKIHAFLEDYAHLGAGLLDLYEAAFDPQWLQAAIDLTDAMLERFLDREGGGFFMSDGADSTLVVRRKETYDGATPSGNSAAAHLLLRLGHLLDRDDYRAAAGGVFDALNSYLQRLPGAVANLLCAAAFSLDEPTEIAIVGDPAAPETRRLIRAAHRRYLPSRIIAAAADDRIGAGANGAVALLKGKRQIGGRPTVYVCRNYACQEPVHTADDMLELLGAPSLGP